MANRVKSKCFATRLRRSWPCQPLTLSRKQGQQKLPNFNLGITNKSLRLFQNLGFSKALGCLYKSLFSCMLLRCFRIERSERTVYIVSNSWTETKQFCHFQPQLVFQCNRLWWNYFYFINNIVSASRADWYQSAIFAPCPSGPVQKCLLGTFPNPS